VDIRRGERSGLYMPDGMHLTHTGADLAVQPDGIFASFDAFQSGRVQQVPNARQVGAVDLHGTPDMVLEVVSDSSEEKDNVILPPKYQAAQIPEFWRIDARAELHFEILRLTPTGYVPTQGDDGWWRSDIFARDFRLVRLTNALGQPRFLLEMR
jgi:Uma2 family endonuclease